MLWQTKLWNNSCDSRQLVNIGNSLIADVEQQVRQLIRPMAISGQTKTSETKIAKLEVAVRNTNTISVK